MTASFTVSIFALVLLLSPLLIECRRPRPPSRGRPGSRPSDSEQGSEGAARPSTTTSGSVDLYSENSSSKGGILGPGGDGPGPLNYPMKSSGWKEPLDGPQNQAKDRKKKQSLLSSLTSRWKKSFNKFAHTLNKLRPTIPKPYIRFYSWDKAK